MPGEEAAQRQPRPAAAIKAASENPADAQNTIATMNERPVQERRGDPADSLLMGDVPRIETPLHSVGDIAFGIDAFSHGPSWPLFWIREREAGRSSS